MIESNQNQNQFFYGLKSKFHLLSIVNTVCTALAYGKQDLLGELLVIETCAAETKLGTYPDSSIHSHGVGVPQIDQICLDDIKQEGEQRHFNIIKSQFGIDIQQVELADLAEDPTLAIIICRLAYKRIPAPIPKTVNARARYWKQHYNTAAGKGTLEHYLSAVEQCLGKPKV